MFNRFERFRLALVKKHARMGWENKYRGIYRCRTCRWRWNKPMLIGWGVERVLWLCGMSRQKTIERKN